mmetsp:Transcript_32293/g.53384  ORF Transcript_32293/g.53384 Transcript_32293/m.53384 type:complete len:618 (+) Transcript_32293:54-1907(+)
MESESLQNEASEDVEVRCHARVSAGRAPSERCLHSCTLMSVDGARVAYLYGGRGKHGPLDDLHMLDLEGNLWTQPKVIGDKPAGRYAHTAIAQGRNIYIFGGKSRGEMTFAFGEEKPPAMFGDKKKGKRETDAEVTDEVLVLDTSSFPSGEWQELGTIGTGPCSRYKHASCLVPESQNKARMFIFGGCDEEGNALGDQWFLDIAAKAWSSVDTSGVRPVARYGHSATLLPAQYKVLVLGGTDGKYVQQSGVIDPEFPSFKSDKALHPMTVHILDIDSLTWSTVACKNHGTGAQPSPRAYHSATLLGKNLFITGGQLHYWLLSNSHYIHGCYILEIVKNQWEHNTIKGDSFIPYPGCALGAHTGCAVDSSSLVIFGGMLQTSSTVEQVNTFWDVATDAKQKLHSSQLPLPTASGAYSTTFKLLVVGDAGVGKTCLITRFVDDTFTSTSKSTIGVDFKATSIEMDGKNVSLQVWDTAGQERFRALTTSYYRGAHGVIVVYDVTEQASFDHLRSWMKDVDLYSGEEVTKLLIGNKDDLPERKVVSADAAREFAKEHQMLFMEASAMRATNVSAAFRLLVAEVMHQADTLASQPPAFEHKLKVNVERSRRAREGNCAGACM